MKPHQQRVIEEEAELRGRLEKLTGFFDSETYRDLKTGEQLRLRRQQHAMQDYLAILQDRIAAFHRENSQKTTVEHAGLLYAVYCEAVGGVAFNGDKLPTWCEFSADESKAKQVNAWLAVAEESLR